MSGINLSLANLEKSQLNNSDLSVGNFIFSALGSILFSLRLSDILYTFILGKTKSFKLLNLESNDFCLCVAIPVKMKRMNAM